MGLPETNETRIRRPPVGLRHYIPLFFLAPSLLLLVHAWNRTAPPPPRAYVDVDTGGFEFPRDIRLDLMIGDAEIVPVEGHRASFPVPQEGPVRLLLLVSRAAGGDRVPVGEPAEFRPPDGIRSVRWTLRVPATDCAAALASLRAAR